jgi:hypothetical protein
LQEVLSAVKLTAEFLSDQYNENPILQKRISRETVNALLQVTENISAVGDVSGAGQESGSSGERFGRYYDDFFSKIKNKNFGRVREKSQAELIQYIRTHCP